MNAHDLISEFLEVFFPSKCAVCGELTGKRAREAVLCDSCRERLLSCMNEKCVGCGKPIHDCECVLDSMKDAGFLFHIKLFYYKSSAKANPANRFIYKMKSSPDERLYFEASRQLYPHAVEIILNTAKEKGLVPVITYIPRSVHSVRKHGSDQALLLARRLAKDMNMSLCKTARRRRIKSKEMKSLSLDERQRESRKMFSPLKDSKINSKTLLVIVDDIVTTGSSVVALANAAKENGVRHFGVISLGQTF